MPRPVVSTIKIRLYQILQFMEVQLVTPTVAVLVHEQFESSLNVCALLREEIVHGLDISIQLVKKGYHIRLWRRDTNQ